MNREFIKVDWGPQLENEKRDHQPCKGKTILFWCTSIYWSKKWAHIHSCLCFLKIFILFATVIIMVLPSQNCKFSCIWVTSHHLCKYSFDNRWGFGSSGTHSEVCLLCACYSLTRRLDDLSKSLIHMVALKQWHISAVWSMHHIEGNHWDCIWASDISHISSLYTICLFSCFISLLFLTRSINVNVTIQSFSY